MKNSSDERERHWRVLERKEVLSVPGRIEVTVEKVTLPNGMVVDDYWQLHTNDYVVVIAETVDKRFICLRQYRHGARRVGLEMVAGGIQQGEQPISAARRELLEETGYVSTSWEFLGAYSVSSAQGLATANLFRAADARKQREPNSGDLEEATIEIMSRGEIIAALRHNDFLCASHVAGLALALLGFPNIHP